MNVLVLTPLYYIEGRPELFHDTSAIHYLVKNWVGEGHKVEVIVTYVNYRSQIKRYINSQQRRYWKNGYSYSIDGVSVYLIEEQLIFDKDWFTALNDYHIVKMVRKYLGKKDFCPDIIVNHFPCYSSRYMPMLGYHVPCIAVLHQTDVKKGIIDEKHRNRLRENYKAVYCRSNTIYEEAYKWELPNLQKEIIYSGAPVSEPPEDRKFDFSATINVLYVGKLIERKNIDLIIQMLPIFKKMVFTIVGEGDELERLNELARDLGVTDRIRFVGSKSRSEVISFMREADVFCMPSVRETFGLVYLEAMSQGCIVIGTRKEGIDGVIIDEVNGFLCEANDIGLKGDFEKIISCSQNELQTISAAAIKTGNRLSEDNVSKMYLHLVERWCKLDEEITTLSD